MPRQHGLSLVEGLCVTTLIALATLAVIPAAATIANGARMAAAARDLAMTFHALRWKSVARSRVHGLSFTRDAGGWLWYEVRDGNGNGLRTAEVRNGVDPTVAGPFRIQDRVARVRPGFPGAGPYPRIGRGGLLNDLDDPIKFGNSNLVSFSPMGSSSSGTVYLTDGRGELFAVVLYGPTGRVRVWRFDAARGRWER